MTIEALPAQFRVRFLDWRKIIAIAGEPAAKLFQFHEMAYDIAGLVIQDGLEKPLANDEMMEIGRSHNLGDDDDLTLFISTEYKRRQDEPTFFDQIPPEQNYRTNGGAAHTGGPQQAKQQQQKQPARQATVYVFPDPASIPRRDFLYAGHYVRNFATATVAPGGFGKTTLTLFELLTMALDGKRVWYISGEDPKVEIDRRIAAHCQYHHIDRSRFDSRLFVDDKKSFPLSIGTSPRTARVLFDETWLACLDMQIAEKQIDVVALDPFISFHSVPEGDNGAIDQIVKRLGLIAQNRTACMELSHHVRKSIQGVTGELTVDDTRGGSSIVNAVRSCRVINRMNGDEAGIAKVSSDKQSSYIRVDKGKRNMAPPDKATWWHIVSVDLPNGDNVQAIERYEFPSPFAGLSTASVDWVQKLLKEGGPRRASSQSEDWLGHEIGRHCGRTDTDTKGGAIWANKIIGEWIRNKVFKKVALRDPVTRKPNVPFYVSNDFTAEILPLNPGDNT